MDKDLFLRKYEEVYRDMYRYALYVLGRGADAEDAVSEAVVDAYRGRDSLKDVDAFRGWIFKILSRKCIAKRREYANAVTVPAETDEYVTDIPDQSPDTGEAAAIRQLFFTLPEEDRTIISLHIFGGYTSREIGELMDMNDATVRSREHRALEKLRRSYYG